MRNTLLLVGLFAAGCTPESAPQAIDVADASGNLYTVDGEVPDDIDLDALVADLPPGTFALVGNESTGQYALVQPAGSVSARLADADFTGTNFGCDNCGIGRPIPGNRRLSIDLFRDLQALGDNARLSVVEYDSENFVYDRSNPNGWRQVEGTTQHLELIGRVDTNASFRFLFSLVTPSKRVFVTSQSWDGNLGGLSGADAKCQDAADTAGLGGTWMAWLSGGDDPLRAKDRLANNTDPYVLVDDETIVAGSGLRGAGGLTDNLRPLEAAISLDENGAALGGVLVWTGTNASGGDTLRRCLTNSADPTTAWTSNSSAVRGAVGNSAETADPDWTHNQSNPDLGNGNRACNFTAHLYCIEQ